VEQVLERSPGVKQRWVVGRRHPRRSLADHPATSSPM